MPSVYQLKSSFQKLLRPLCGGLVSLGISANGVTIFALLLSMAGGACIARWPHESWPLLLLPALLLLRMALNAIDGMIAREFNMQSRLGALLNELGDVLSDAALYLPLALVPAFDAHLVVAIVILAILSEFVGVLGPSIGASRRYDGPMGKSDRAFVFGAAALALGGGSTNGNWVPWVEWLVLAGLILTIFNRSRQALSEGGVN